MDFGTQGEWGWTDRTVSLITPAAWQNPGGGFGVCPTWVPKLAVCIPTAGGPDQVYRLNGTTGGGGTPTPTPSARLPAAPPTPRLPGLAQSRLATLTPATIATIAQPNHPPFPLTRLRADIYSTMSPRTASLDLTGTKLRSPMAVRCCRARIWNTAIFPYQDDLRTDAQSGCSAFPGGNCGIFTSVTGLRLTGSLTSNGAQCTLPTSLRQPTLKWCFTRTKQRTLTSSTAQLPTTALMKPAACKQARPAGYDVLVRHRPRSRAA